MAQATALDLVDRLEAIGMNAATRGDEAGVIQALRSLDAIAERGGATGEAADYAGQRVQDWADETLAN